MKDDIAIEYCPWCGSVAVPYTEGSYSNGWVSHVLCSNSLDCGAQGPTKRTRGCSNDNWVIESEAIKDWNSVVKKRESK